MLTNSKEDLIQIEERIKEIQSYAYRLEERFQPILESVHPKNQKSALNLLHYIALRHHNIDDIQRHLSSVGISSLQHAEGHVMANIQMVLRIIHQLASKETNQEEAPVSFTEGIRIRANNRKAVFGPNPHRKRSVHIMVTFPTEAATQYSLVKKMIKAGMDCARINCAKDDEKVWEKMIKNVRKAEEELGTHCKILMDLAGPKIRTGSIKKGPKVIKIIPFQGFKGETIKPATLRFSTKFKQPSKNEAVIPVGKNWLSKIQKGDKVLFTDTRGHKRKIEIKKVEKKGAVADLDKASFLDEGTELVLRRNNKIIEKTTIGKIPAAKQYILLKKGDLLYLHKDDQPGEPPQYNEAGKIKRPGHIGCSLPEIFDDVETGDPISFDDGKIKGKITETSSDQLTVEVTYAKNDQRSLKPDKGINLPESYLSVSGLTDKDLKDLDFVVRHADIVNLSFVRDPKDVLNFLEELKNREAEKIAIMLKIETQRAVNNLPWLILHAMQHYPVSIMLARGDLAIETGWEEMAVLQDEILWLCEAAHVPSVWATQVLEGMAKKGLPKRAEITDAAMAHQADCVMLNKGKYTIETIEMLEDILQKMEKQKMKSSNLVQQLNIEEAFLHN